MPALSALLNAAFARHQAGDLAMATQLYKDILRDFPQQPDALHMLGVIAKQQGNNELALKLIEVALGQRTDMPLGWHNRALILRLLGRKDEALQSAEQAVSLDPNLAEAWDLMGFLLRDKRDFKRSREAHARAVALKPHDLKFLGNYAHLLMASNELPEAYTILRAIESRDPNLLPHMMGNLLRGAGYPHRALDYYRRSAAQMPDNDEVRITEAMAHLLVGNFAAGWKIWETRPDLDKRFHHVPQWRGGKVAHLLLHEDQGMGDAFQCARFIEQLKPFAGRITVQVTRALQRVLLDSMPDVEILTLDNPVPAADARIRLLSLPAFFSADAATVPTPIPYLHANAEQQQKWGEALAHVPRPRIGLVWGGNPDHLNDKQRSIPFAQIAPLVEAGAGHLVSLQKGAQKKNADLAAAGIFDADPMLQDFADTAGLLANLDLLITVDTSVVHLAGAMGKPVWLLLPFDPDWRWLLGRKDSPWYPTLRLFRQHRPRDWSDAIARVTADLQSYLGGDASILEPERWVDDCVGENPQAVKLS